jgi:threonyl-tRNA synthetase
MPTITLTFPDGSTRTYPSGITGREVAESIGRRLASDALAIGVDGKTRDLARPITHDATIRIYTWADEQGKRAYWHSSAHLMAEAVEQLFPGTKFGIGPAIEEGFYYDIDVGDHTLTAEDLGKIEERMRELSQSNQPFVREDVQWDQAVQRFREKGDEYKLELLEGLKGEPISLYHSGSFTDLCSGPHIPSTGRIKAIKLLTLAGAYWRGNEKNKMLQRIYGVTFPTQKELEEHLHLLEEARKRDHRRLGVDLELFLLTPNVGSGLPIWLPKGALLRETLIEFLRAEQSKRGYEWVVTPHIANLDLYRTSGHYPYYKDSQFPPITLADEHQFLLKPMNCPHHHQVYLSKPRSYRDLPLRLAEFGTVYRYEQSGEMNGLIRVRGFTQDDAHIYCTHEQLKDELKSTIELTQLVFDTFGMEVRTRLSYRDDENVEKYGGDRAFWDQAQREIKEVADEMGLDYFIAIGEASFYGPKIDFMVRDALRRTWQLGTVQVDYVMPERFQLEFTASDGQKHRPVIIHRAPFGSLERFIGILIEHYAGEFPLWLAPVQAVILPITDHHQEYARTVLMNLREAGIRAEVDLRNEKVNYKIRDWETKKVPYMLVVGDKEQNARSVAVRKHRKGDTGAVPLEDLRDRLCLEIREKTITS